MYHCSILNATDRFIIILPFKLAMISLIWVNPHSSSVKIDAYIHHEQCKLVDLVVSKAAVACAKDIYEQMKNRHLYSKL